MLLLLLLFYYIILRLLIFVHGQECRCIDRRLQYCLAFYKGVRIILKALSQELVDN